MEKAADPGDLIRAEQGASYERWHLPELENAGKLKVVSSTPQKQQQKQPEDPLRKPLTASRIAAIREAARKEGFAEGKEQGYHQGITQARAEIERTVSTFNGVMGRLIAPLAEQDRDLEQAMVHLCVQLAETVVGQEVDFDRDMLLRTVRQAVAQLAETSQQIRVLLNPQDVEVLNQAAQDRSQNWQILAEPSLSRGGCIVKTEHSYVDYCRETQFRMLLDKLLKQERGAARGADPHSTETPL